MRLILMGTGPFAVPSFDALRAAGHEIALVVTKPEPQVRSRKGPPPAPVRQWATENDLPVFDPVSINESDAISHITSLRADLLVVCDYGHILVSGALAAAPLGGINLHGSLLPAYRGAAPVQRALLSGDRVTGVTVIHMTPKLDGGPILASVETPIRDDETAGELETRLSELGVAITLRSVEMLAQWDRQSEIGEPQDPAKVSKAPRLNKAEANIDWTRTAREIDCLVRGMQPWPVAFTHVATHPDKPPVRLAILEVEAVEADTSGLQPGQILGDGNFSVAVGDGAIAVKRLCPAGKREMGGEEFLRGHQLGRGTPLS
ncbi:methionyl-tRNA formyltransferase [Stieleria varia]|uniref:Methionyl-tRNA formyltransferase n=1 Tax=Stieleria varia TaxID=2528005 RepID=A0A5C6AGC3_9BACT|nr:methionyl-tRNA formyltransferase [Stieleria varia]TWT98456.1 Methionyl-tRNA formyltransferase [Stieleria varia]